MNNRDKIILDLIEEKSKMEYRIKRLEELLESSNQMNVYRIKKIIKLTEELEKCQKQN